VKKKGRRKRRGSQVKNASFRFDAWGAGGRGEKEKKNTLRFNELRTEEREKKKRVRKKRENKEGRGRLGTLLRRREKERKKERCS